MHRVQNSSQPAGFALKPIIETEVIKREADDRPRPLREAAADDAVAAPAYSRTVHHGGNRYFATAGMAEIFRAKTRKIVASGETELVPLLHSTGVDLLVIGPNTQFTVVTIEIGHHTAA
ncbi:hypothetical protein [Subtercola endophyticus]|uniref:hypothetical protein n=1 Tax=Subtercola endophyticus TaxID=2895559 RepID=UPI001E46C83B|nr:hypothetical protein [Subtercola endophyticus]UFS58874.1 hypothetical protein LQ955_18045 [Subtercola endophyticus]